MMQKFRFDRNFTTMNDLTRENRTVFIHENGKRWFKGASTKKEETDWVKVMAKVQLMKPFTKPVRIKCFWNYNNNNQDPDNIRTQVKPILDGLKAAGILPKDSLAFIKGFDGDEYNKSEHEGGELHIYEIEE